MEDFNKRLVEVDVILSYLSDEDYKKIPFDVIKIIKENKDTQYIWNFDESKPLKDQNLHRDTISILSYLNMEYLLNEKQKQYIQKIHIMNEQEKNKQEHLNENNFDYNTLFKTHDKKTDTEQTQFIQETSLAKKTNIFTKIIEKIKSLFR